MFWRLRRPAAFPVLPAIYFAPIAAALIPDGPNGQLCASMPEETGTGIFRRQPRLRDRPRSISTGRTRRARPGRAKASCRASSTGRSISCVGGIYSESHLSENSYYVNAFAIDYISGVLGSFTALGRGLPPAYPATPFFRNNTDDFKLTSYGIFGEAYLDFNDRLKLTAGIRYNNDEKSVRARSTLRQLPCAVQQRPTSSIRRSSARSMPIRARRASRESRNAASSTGEFTGRAVIDWKVTDDNLLYASYSRGYKSGGINPPLHADLRGARRLQRPKSSTRSKSDRRTRSPTAR